MNRARFAVSATSGAVDNITGAQREQYNLAKQKFDAVYEKLKRIHETDFPAFESELEKVGIKWIPGSFPPTLKFSNF